MTFVSVLTIPMDAELEHMELCTTHYILGNFQCRQNRDMPILKTPSQERELCSVLRQPCELSRVASEPTGGPGSSEGLGSRHQGHPHARQHVAHHRSRSSLRLELTDSRAKLHFRLGARTRPQSAYQLILVIVASTTHA